MKGMAVIGYAALPSPGLPAVWRTLRRGWTRHGAGWLAASGMLAAAPAAHSAVTTLAPTVVTATASDQALATVPASVSVVSGAALRERPVLDLADALRGTEGVTIQSAGLGRQAVSIRGMDAAHTLFLVDGRRISRSASGVAHSDYELGWVPPEAIEQVEVVRGPLSSLYGSEALGGVVNVVTRAATDQWQGSASAYRVTPVHRDGGDTGQTAFYAGGPLVTDRLGVTLWGSVQQRRALDDRQQPGLSLRDRQHARQGHVGLSWTPAAAQRVDLSLDSGHETRRDRRGSVAAPYVALDTVRREQVALSHQGDWDWGGTAFKLYRSSLRRTQQRTDDTLPAGPNAFTDTVAEASVHGQAYQDHQWRAGVSLRRETLRDPTVNRRGRASQPQQAVWLQDEWRLAQAWTLLLGGRVDWHQAFGSAVSPRAYLVHEWSDTLTMKVGVGRAFKAPTLKQLSPEYESWGAMGGRGIIRGNPDLDPERSQSWEAGLDYDGARWQGNVTWFQNDVRNLIETQRAAECDVRGRTCLYYQNVAQARMRGVSLRWGAALAAAWRVDLNYQWLDARARDSGAQLPDRPRHSGYLSLVWTPTADWRLQWRTEIIGRQLQSGSATEAQPGYALMALYGDYALTKAVTLRAGMENIGDRRLAAEAPTRYSLADVGRRVYAGVSVRF